MNATLGKKLRFSDVAYSIGTTPKSLRLWLQRGLVEIHTPKPEGGGWTEYSFFDIAILALVRAFVNFGVDVQTASDLANQTMNFFPQTMTGWKKKDAAPAGVLAVSWVNRRLHCWPSGDTWQLRCVALWESDLERRAVLAQAFPDRAVGPNDANPSLSDLRKEIEPVPAYLTIDVEAVLRTAFERANESVNDGAVEDEE